MEIIDKNHFIFVLLLPFLLLFIIIRNHIFYIYYFIEADGVIIFLYIYYFIEADIKN